MANPPQVAGTGTRRSGSGSRSEYLRTRGGTRLHEHTYTDFLRTRSMQGSILR